MIVVMMTQLHVQYMYLIIDSVAKVYVVNLELCDFMWLLLCSR